MSTGTIKGELEINATLVNNFILSYLNGSPKELYRASAHYISSGGKRIRPFILLKSSELFGGTSRKAMPAAAAVELIHNFSLVHDDIMDNDKTRHNVPTVHTSYGIPLAILAGDILFSKAFQLIDDLIGIVGDPRITGKAVGNDIREGKKTFPLILVLEKAGSNERNKLLKIFGSRRTNDRELEEALRIISGLRIEKEIRDLAESYIDRALQSLEVYADSEPKSALQTSADFILRRSL